ncbi:SAV_6107 family HEPN domain-containing protein [uncultured Pseudokineococcus sp.]|uniref:SAV_6107 family HEPN domain-containing protein n=1 Tax=uncultured Pseudokineococcus sp. TaxID=1642928 RepID=UPI00261DC5CC|nr:SAV_6107 family HEPN domain-containing protein [uncultured Pseudokineococcus sp.]
MTTRTTTWTTTPPAVGPVTTGATTTRAPGRAGVVAGAGPVLAGRPAAAAADLLARARDGLGLARAAATPGDRYVASHLAALRSAAAVLAVRGRPRRGAVLGVWQVLPRVAPELAEWALLFAAGAPRRAAVEAERTGVVSARDADDLLRDAEAFAGVVADVLGLPRPVPTGPVGLVAAGSSGLRGSGLPGPGGER